MEERECTCGYNPLDTTDQCYCPYVPTVKIRKITPLPPEEREDVEPEAQIIPDGMSLIAWLAQEDLLTPG